MTSEKLGRSPSQSSWPNSRCSKMDGQMINRKGRWERWVFASFVFSCFFPFFISTFPYVQKSRKTKKKQKNNPVRRIWSKSIPDCFFVFWFSSFFSRFFGVPSPNCPKTRRKPKKTKKTNPVRRILGKSIQDWFFCFFLVYLVFLEVFAVPSPTVQKLEENQKKPKKTIL